MPDTWVYHENRRLFGEGLKRCSKCGKVKSLDEFHKANPKVYKTGRKSACKKCQGIRNPQPEKVTEEQKAFVAENKALVKKGKKRCSKCRKVKPLDSYWKNKNTTIGGRKTVCIECDRERTREWTNRWNRKNRMEALQKYGGKCACCGESRFEFLAIDHAKGGGNKHRKSGQFTPGSGFIKWLKREGWPKGFRVLCHNCNSAIGYYGSCPHSKKR